MTYLAGKLSTRDKTSSEWIQEALDAIENRIETREEKRE